MLEIFYEYFSDPLRGNGVSNCHIGTGFCFVICRKWMFVKTSTVPDIEMFILDVRNLRDIHVQKIKIEKAVKMSLFSKLL